MPGVEAVLEPDHSDPQRDRLHRCQHDGEQPGQGPLAHRGERLSLAEPVRREHRRPDQRRERVAALGQPEPARAGLDVGRDEDQIAARDEAADLERDPPAAAAHGQDQQQAHRREPDQDQRERDRDVAVGRQADEAVGVVGDPVGELLEQDAAGGHRRQAVRRAGPYAALGGHQDPQRAVRHGRRDRRGPAPEGGAADQLAQPLPAQAERRDDEGPGQPADAELPEHREQDRRDAEERERALGVIARVHHRDEPGPQADPGRHLHARRVHRAGHVDDDRRRRGDDAGHQEPAAARAGAPQARGHPDGAGQQRAGHHPGQQARGDDAAVVRHELDRQPDDGVVEGVVVGRATAGDDHLRAVPGVRGDLARAGGGRVQVPARAGLRVADAGRDEALGDGDPGVDARGDLPVEDPVGAHHVLELVGGAVVRHREGPGRGEEEEAHERRHEDVPSQYAPQHGCSSHRAVGPYRSVAAGSPI